MKKLIQILALVLAFALIASAQTPPVVNSNGTITGTLHGTLNGNVLTITSPGAAGATPALANTNLPNPVLAGTTGAISGALLAGACDTGTATVAGATTAMVGVANASTSGAPGAGFTVETQVTSANTVTVSVCAIVNGTPTSSTYLVRVIS